MAIAYNTSLVQDQMHVCLDFANIKTYPGSGTTAVNLKRLGNFTLFNTPTIANGYMTTNGLNPGNYIFETSELGNHGTNSFTYQLLVRPQNSSSLDSPTEVRLYEQSGFPATYHILGISHNNGNRSAVFFGRDTTQLNSFYVNTPINSIVLNTWYLLTAIIDRTNNVAALYLNGRRYQTSIANVTGSIGNAASLRFPSSYAEAAADYAVILGYRKALTHQEVLSNYEALRGRYGI